MFIYLPQARSIILLLNALEINRRRIPIEFIEIRPIELDGKLKIIISVPVCYTLSDSRESLQKEKFSDYSLPAA